MEKINQGDMPEDQFTGEDPGAQMAAAERGRVQCLLCAEHDACSDGDGHVSEEVGICLITLQFRALHFPRQCADFKPLPIEPLRTEGYRVGDAYEGGDADTPPHLKGPIVQAYADTNGIPPKADETGEA